jgi:Mrp family chromosome partitioning ATPase
MSNSNDRHMTPPRAVPTLAVMAEIASDTAVPRLPTVVVSSWKGGVWKTCLSASIAERLAFAGMDVLYLVTDDQLDARRRLGLSEADPDIARVARGPGSVTIVGLAGAHAIDVLYRSGPVRLGRFDAIVVDTPPVKKGGCLPGVLLVTPTDGDDASANLIRMLRATPANTEIVLVRIDRVPKAEWAHDAAVIAEASNRTAGIVYLPDPLPRTVEVREALNRGRSVWTLTRRGATLDFLRGVESLAGLAWARARPETAFPPLAPAGPAGVHIHGWDDGA